MLKVYYYTDQEVGISWPGPDPNRAAWCKSQGIPHPRFVWYEWPGFVTTTNPAQADVYVVHQRLYEFTDETIDSLPYYKGDARHRHVFFGLGPDVGRSFRDLSHYPGVFLRACVNQDMLKSDPDIVAWPWPVDDLGAYAALPPGGFGLDAMFQGQVVGYTKPVIDSVENSNLKSHIVRLSEFFSVIRHRDPERGAELRESYLRSMQNSRIVLCPNDNPHGAIRYRLYEAMSMGRVGLFVGDECVLPFSEKIDWQNCIVQISNRDMGTAGEFLENWLGSHSDAEITAMGAHAREMWVHWLKRERWGEIAGLKIREILGL